MLHSKNKLTQAYNFLAMKPNDYLEEKKEFLIKHIYLKLLNKPK
jgi:hypothetical protein